MTHYEDGKIQKLFDNLVAQGVDAAMIAEIMEGGEDIVGSSTPKRKGEWLIESMNRMDRLLPPDVITKVREGCACCLGGKRLMLSKSAYKQHDTLEERVAAIDAAKIVCGHSVTMTSENEFIVRFQPEDGQAYHCVCLPKVQGTPTNTYCQCCGGHVRHHMQTALGFSLRCEIIHTALTSFGQQGCAFRLTRA